MPSPRVEVQHSRASYYRLAPGGLVFARTGASVGKSYLYDPSDGDLVYAGFLINIEPDPCVLNPYYFAAYAQSREYWNWVASTSMRSGQPGINSQEYAQLPVPVPDMQVQNTIAGIATDAQTQITTLERLIAKKEAIKQGMMQQLLTGQTRLPGFTGVWKEWPMGSLGATYGGLVGKTKEDFGVGEARYIPFMAVMASTWVTGRSHLRVRVGDAERQNVVKAGDLLFNASSETPDELAMCAVAADLSRDTYLNSFCFGFRLSADDAADALFLAYLFRSGVGRRLMRTLAQGAIRYNLSKSQFRDVVVVLPPIDEQRAIVGVLDAIGAVIGALRGSHTKAKAVRQGMMQELLTGRTRLPVAEVVRA